MIDVSNDLGLEVWKSPKTKKLKGHIVKNVKASLPMTVFCSNLKGAINPLKLEHWRVHGLAHVWDEPQDERYSRGGFRGGGGGGGGGSRGSGPPLSYMKNDVMHKYDVMHTVVYAAFCMLPFLDLQVCTLF